MATRVPPPVAPGAAGASILGLSILKAAALAAIVVVTIIGGVLIVGGGLGGAGSPPVASVPVEPSLTSPPASVMAGGPASPIVSPSVPVAPPEPFAGRFEVTWTVVSVALAPDMPTDPRWVVGATGANLVEITCGARGCAVFPITASGERDTRETPLFIATGGPWPVTASGQLTHTYQGAHPDCGPEASFLATSTYTGVDPVTSGGVASFGALAGSASIKNQQLRVGNCSFRDWAIEFTGVRIGP